MLNQTDQEWLARLESHLIHHLVAHMIVSDQSGELERVYALRESGKKIS